MRRAIGLTLAGLGACLIVFAMLLPTYVSRAVVKFPLNEYQTVTLTGTGGSYFSPTRLAEVTGVTMEAVYTIKGDAAEGSSSTAVWDEFSYTYDLTSKTPFQYMARTLAFDRRTAQLVDCCGASVNGNTAISQDGVAGIVFPIGTRKQTYEVFDSTLLRPEPFTYSGSTTIGGIGAYVFTENVPSTRFTTQTLPGSLAGMSQPSVTLPEYDRSRLVYDVDPETGALLDVRADQQLTLVNPATGAPALVLYDGDLTTTPASVTAAVQLDRSMRGTLTLIGTILPLATGMAGAVVLAAGVLLWRKPREDAVAGPAIRADAVQATAGPPGDPA